MFNEKIIQHRRAIVIVFAILTVLSVIAQFFVSVNYNMADYMPDEAPSTKSQEVMEEEFTASIPNTNVLVQDVTLQEALHYKERLHTIEGVTDVMWLDDVLDVVIPLEFIDDSIVETYYKNHDALYSLTIELGYEVDAIEEIYEVIGEGNAVSGEAANTATSQTMATTETVFAASFLIPIILLFLIVSTKSWIEPVFFLTAIGVSVLMNLGTNIFIGEISYVTQSVAPILQLAVSLDYAIFLLHNFSDELKRGHKPETAMSKAMKSSFPVITMSALTTFFGFMTLMLMDFEIGSDLGFNLVKGIAFSYLAVIVFLPALTLIGYRWMKKTEHRNFVPSFEGIGAKILKLRIPALILVLALIVPSFLAQSSTSFTYGLGELPLDTRAGADAKQIEETFGESTPMVVLVPNDDIAKEEALAKSLEQLPHVDSVMSYATAVGSLIPSEFLSEQVTSDFFSENYSRIMVFTNAGVEGEAAFELVEQTRELATAYYGDNVHTLGESVALYDMKDVVTDDNTIVMTMTVATIALILMIAFRSFSIPIVLLVTIQASVWINLSIPYFTNDSLVFIGYLIVSTVQLAATIDYAILIMETYKHHRTTMPKVPAMKKSLDEKVFPVTISAGILSSVGFVLWFVSSNPTVASIGLLLGRGAAIAFLLVIFFLPAITLLSDRFIKKTTYRANFYEGEKE
ncbi:RND family transporter [Geomicrobium sp. JCM 19038]|uniref:efflux RND transporter permease subunit n=1 Tax=Geomicrobium sp. JCM 19038 TaxID=1460635 RepID=UPI00045F2CF6|nr:MMPL family transporter [Geomicrobium sp. JCM 19038]GAK08255.1 hypothetical protein JCM19038_2032 [Geomicrobium sp. JCM 19038]